MLIEAHELQPNDVRLSTSTPSPWSFRRFSGSLVVVPAVVLVFGSSWTVERRFEPPTAVHERAGEPAGTLEVPAYLVPEAAQLEQGIVLAPGDGLTFELPGIRDRFALEVQAFHRDAYTLFVSTDGEAFERLWSVPAAGQRGMQTRRGEFERPETPITHVKLTPRGARSEFRVSGLAVVYTAAVVSHYWLIPVLWGGWLLAVAAYRWPLSAAIGERVLAGWCRVDVWAATIVSAAILFRLTPEVLAIGVAIMLLAAGIALFSRYFSRSPVVTVSYVVFLYLLFFVVLPYGLTRVVAARAAELYDFTIDHRMRPDGREINSDGIRFRGDAADLRDEDFVVLQLGDSFTYGLGLDYDDSYPYVLERLLADLDCSQRVRVVNFGWTSASPLLSLRLLRQVGARYRPDLIVYNLDMTDFADDLRYERELSAAGDLHLDHRAIARELLRMVGARLPALAAIPEALARLTRAKSEAAAGEPRDRYFVTARSLDETRADIERGVVKNLAEMHAYATGELRARMALVIYPRAYQYSARESPKNWEAHRYQRLGQYALEPFEYFREVREELPYPVFSLLPAFASAESFPLFQEDDPHWNRDGARLAAEAVAGHLVDADLVPCPIRVPAAGARRSGSG